MNSQLESALDQVEDVVINSLQKAWHTPREVERFR